MHGLGAPFERPFSGLQGGSARDAEEPVTGRQGFSVIVSADERQCCRG